MFNTYDAFKSCDMNDDGIVTGNEIRRLMESKGMYVNSQDIDNIVGKFDKDRDGKISYNEFAEEFLPRSPQRMH